MHRKTNINKQNKKNSAQKTTKPHEINLRELKKTIHEMTHYKTRKLAKQKFKNEKLGNIDRIILILSFKDLKRKKKTEVGFD